MAIDHRRAAWWLAAAFAAALGFFWLWPGADLRVSALFYRDGEGFWIGSIPGIETLRNAVWNLSLAVALFALAALALAAARRPAPDFGARAAGFVLLLYVLGPGLLVNAILKNHWGRARPGSIVEFGGTQSFTPPWLPSDQCDRNCSFVSGEGSGAVALAISFVVLAPLARRVLPRMLFPAYAAAGVILPATGLFLRVATGRHFLSDTVFAALLVLAIALALHRWLMTDRR